MSLMPRRSAQALTRRADDSQLMPPPPKRIKRPKNVIDEESYTDAISEIIARDFFPGLLETETQQEYLDALDSQDTAWISNVGRRLQHVMTPSRPKGRRGTSIQIPPRASETPKGEVGETPYSVTSGVTTRAPKQPEVDTSLSLDRFQSLYTSEDNESFYKLIDKSNKKRAEKYAWMWSANSTLPSKMMLKQKEVEVKLLKSRGSLEDDSGDRNRLAIKLVSDKPARPDAWDSKPNNELMFPPDSVEDALLTQAQKAQTDSRAAPKGISHINTRMPLPAVVTESSSPGSPSVSAVRDAIDGHRRTSEEETDCRGNDTPRVNGYAYVDDEPEEVDLSFVPPALDLGKGDSARNPFTIQQQSKREDLHHQMVDKNARTKRVSLKNGMTGKVDMTPVPKFPSSPRLTPGHLTPAAQRLWGRVGRGMASGPSSIKTPNVGRVKSTLRTRWTPNSKEGKQVL